MKYLDLWSFILTSLQNKRAVALLCVAENTKGSPGRQNFKMAINALGHKIGTIGGGIMEYKLLEKAKAFLASRASVQLCIPQDHKKEFSKFPSGMICSGSQLILIHTIFDDNTAFMDSLQTLLGNPAHQSMSLYLSNEQIAIVENTENAEQKQNWGFKKTDAKTWVYREVLRPSMYIYIVGGGHVGLALSKVLSLMDTYITVFDHRENLDTILKNQSADRIIIGSYEKIGQYIYESERSYGLVVSTSFKTDEQGTKALLTKRLRYLGMMGSQAKIGQIFSNLRKAGFTEEQLRQIKAPIGLPIKSRTVDEIGISIAAELIQEKNKIENIARNMSF